jgi:hypothetical protein
MASSGMLRRVALVITDVSEELSASFIRVTRIGELGTLAVTSNRRMQANYTATCRRNLVPTFVDRAVSRSQRGGSLMAVNLSFLHQSHYCFFQAAPRSCSRG